ncbi:Cd(II)/Pb(II)-responsive transcriptional regulator [Teredinibacter turnerae]|uniref:Cd(II)/Pb(II)-responsive transcriptional regulator n=1 Tax=Teredinibacter turnerae TaxID=2426 RepID=UPI000372FAA1|nr:Cd(II)/Pb(II)-responsive transcriptional regulator [Teredinibacter turnerae]
MKIGELAKRSGCSIQTIRYYEKEGLVTSAARSEGNFRLYDQQVLERLTFVKHCRSLDLSLAEIRQLQALIHSPNEQCNDVNRMIDSHIVQVEERIQELTKLCSQLKALRGQCSDEKTVEQCGILRGLVDVHASGNNQ